MSVGGAPDFVLTVGSDGAWTITGKETRSGTLSESQLSELTQAIEAATISSTQPEVTCAAIPNFDFTIVAKGMSAKYVDQCGRNPRRRVGRAPGACPRSGRAAGNRSRQRCRHFYSASSAVTTPTSTRTERSATDDSATASTKWRS